MRRVGAIALAVAAAVIAVLMATRSGEGPARAADGRRPGAPLRSGARQGVAGKIASGTVLDDETGAPVAGARLTLHRQSLDLPEAQVIGTLATDDAGAFAVPLPQAEDCRLVAEAEGYPPHSIWVDPEGMEIRLERGEETTFTIVDDEGRPAAAAEVDVFADMAMRLRLGGVRANAAGVATLRLTGDETLLVCFPGHAYEALHRYRPSEWPAEVVLVPEYTIGGRIVDSAGDPIPGASVRLRQGTDCETVSEYGPTAVAGRDGGFLFRGVHGCACELTVKASGCVERCVRAAPGDERMRVVMRRAATASGLVVMPDGAPARGAKVHLDWSYDYRRREGTQADAEGRFALVDLAPRRQELFASGEGELRARIEIAPAEGEAVSGLRLDLRPPTPQGSFLRLQVVDERGRAVEGAAVEAHNGKGTTDRDGLASLDTGAPPRFRTTITVTPPAEEPRRLIGTCVPAITSPRIEDAPVLDIVLHDGVFVRVEARAPDGAAVTDASSELFRDGIESGRQFGNPVEHEEGWYVDPHDTYLVRVRAKGFVLFERWRWSPREAAGVFTATLRPCASVKGRVVGARGVPPDEIHATVSFNLDRMGMGRRLECGPDGSFLLEELEEGTGMLTLGHARGAAQAGVEITTVSGRVTDVGSLVLVPDVVLTGSVVDSDALPVGGARVVAETGLPDCYAGTYSRADGVFRVVVPGFAASRLVVRKDGLGTVRVAVARGAGGALGDITMPAPGALDVDVEGVDWLETEYLTVDVAWQGEPTGSVDEGLCWQHDPRPYRVDDLAPGRYIVRLSAGDLSLQKDVEILGGETANVTFRLR